MVSLLQEIMLQLPELADKDLQVNLQSKNVSPLVLTRIGGLVLESIVHDI